MTDEIMLPILWERWRERHGWHRGWRRPCGGRSGGSCTSPSHPWTHGSCRSSAHCSPSPRPTWNPECSEQTTRTAAASCISLLLNLTALHFYSEFSTGRLCSNLPEPTRSSSLWHHRSSRGCLEEWERLSWTGSAEGIQRESISDKWYILLLLGVFVCQILSDVLASSASGSVGWFAASMMYFALISFALSLGKHGAD